MKKAMAIAIGIMLLSPLGASGTINLTITRLSDTSATLTFEGPDGATEGSFAAPTPSARSARVYLWDPFEGARPTTPYTLSDNTVLTSQGYTFSSCDASGGPGETVWRLDKYSSDYRSTLRIYFSANNTAGATVSGSVTATCSDGAWKAVGSSGPLYYGSDGVGVLTTLTGTWTIVDAVAPPEVWHPGDANKDNVVDLQDFGLLKENFGAVEGATWGQGDFNADSAVDLQDFGILKDHFGHTNGDSPVTAAPEPATLSLLALAGLGLLRARRVRGQ